MFVGFRPLPANQRSERGECQGPVLEHSGAMRTRPLIRLRRTHLNTLYFYLIHRRSYISSPSFGAFVARLPGARLFFGDGGTVAIGGGSHDGGPGSWTLRDFNPPLLLFFPRPGDDTGVRLRSAAAAVAPIGVGVGGIKPIGDGAGGIKPIGDGAGGGGGGGAAGAAGAAARRGSDAGWR